MKNWRKQDPNFELEKNKYPHPVPSRKFILDLLKEKPRSFATLASEFALNLAEKVTLEHRLKAMLRDGELHQSNNNKFSIPKPQPTRIGKVFANAEGYGFLINPDGDDWYISFQEMQKAMHNDTVEAVLKESKGSKKEAKIIKVIEHANTTVVGKLINDHGIWRVISDNRRIHHAIVPDNVNESNAQHNQIVQITISKYPQPKQPIHGNITKIIGDHMDDGVEIDIAINKYELPHEWNKDVIAETVNLDNDISEVNYIGRVDLRHVPFVTIDGIDSRDFDDAVYAKKTSNGFKILVAIADVAHYVEKDSALDIEALKRGTSVYFPNRVIPMLPEKISNELCSLNPKVDRLVMVCDMLIDENGKTLRSKFYPAVIHSHARLTYDLVQSILFEDNKILAQDFANLLPSLIDLKLAYLALLIERKERGAIDFHTQEPVFEYNSAGKIEHIRARQELEAYKLIEVFMVNANVCAAAFIIKNKAIALFRNHEGPKQEKLLALTKSLSLHGITLKNSIEAKPEDIAELVENIKNHPQFGYLQTLILRSMFQAVYQAENNGHFGLALEKYAHFTSPIRRYPDLLVHRAIKHILINKKALYIYNIEQMQELGVHCSMTERRAEEASQDVIAFLKCDYMYNKLGEVFTGKISGVTTFGLFVTIDNEFVDGLVHISNLKNDYFQFDEVHHKLIGERSGTVYQLGDKVTIRVAAVNPADRKIDFQLLEQTNDNGNQPKNTKTSNRRTNNSRANNTKAKSKNAVKTKVKIPPHIAQSITKSDNTAGKSDNAIGKKAKNKSATTKTSNRKSNRKPK